jgi:exopolyphosphatase/guanosine-5'-triphosphate,3'-diphosphate pyrophosphatase
MRVAAVDVGTNTVRLLLATAQRAGGRVVLDPVERYEVITRLGEGLDATGRLGEQPMERALAGLRRYADIIGGADVAATGGVATAATRSAANGHLFVERMAAILGFLPRVIDGVEEARLAFTGATAHLASGHVYCVIDVGGGSTEFVIGAEYPEYAASIDIGSVRLTERMVALGLGDRTQARRHVDELFDDVVAPVAPDVVLGSGGTFVTLAAVAKQVTTDSIERAGVVVLSFEDVERTVDLLLDLAVDEIASLPSVPAPRAAVLQAGVICAERALAHIGADAVQISVSDILDGVAMELAMNLGG